MKRTISREERRQLAISKAKQPATLTLVPYDVWPDCLGAKTKPIAVFRSRSHVVQVYDEGAGIKRLSVIRALVKDDGNWDDGMTWEELQEVKRQVGMGDSYAASPTRICVVTVMKSLVTGSRIDHVTS